MSISNLVRSNILTLETYQSKRPVYPSSKMNQAIWLNANEYPLAPNYIPHKINLNRYPLAYQKKKLINNYAAYAEVNPEQILVCRGANEGIELLIRTFCEPGTDAIICCPPTYNMYSISAKLFSVTCYSIPSLSNWQLNIQEIKPLLHKVKLIYICNPNNPTGNLINSDDLRLLLELIQDNALLVIDEAYIDFCLHSTLVNWVNHYPNLVILRTLSKAFALAGIRCGFIITNLEIKKWLQKVSAPYPVALPVIDIAEQALSYEGIHHTHIRITEIHNNRTSLIYDLKTCPCVNEVYHSVTNYVLVRFNPNYPVFNTLWNHGIIVRDQNTQYGLTNCLRITVGSKTECKHIIKVLKKISLS